MDVRIVHFYPDLMSLYGSYANVSLLARTLTQMGNRVTVDAVRPGQEASITGADVLFMGAGTERRQKAALADFSRYGPAVRAAAEEGAVLLFCGTAMELLGKTITDRDGRVFEGAGLADFTTEQTAQRFVEDVYGVSPLFEQPLVGFMNKCGVVRGVTSPLISEVRLGYGNEGAGGAEGYHRGSVFASELTGPILVKNPALLKALVAAIYQKRGETPGEIPIDEYLQNGYAVTAEQLRLRSKKPAQN